MPAKRVWRIALALLVALALAPGLFWRTSLRPNHDQVIFAEPLPIPAGEAARIGGPDGPIVTGIWHLTSPNDDFGSYSALLMPQPGVLLGISDRGRTVRMAVPPQAENHVAMHAVFPGSDDYKPLQDIESATRNPATGQIWLGFEGRNAIVRTDPDFRDIHKVRPPEMRFWPVNTGPESMVRLTDGRFIVLSEALAAEQGTASMGLLFPADPVTGVRPRIFSLKPPQGYSPSDITLLPDGRVLILVRGVFPGMPPHFGVKLLMADPAEIRPGQRWAWREVADLGGNAVPYDNYEGIVVTGGENGGPVTMWIVSDENEAVWLQRSLLLRLQWQVPPRAAARAQPTTKKRAG